MYIGQLQQGWPPQPHLFQNGSCAVFSVSSSQCCHPRYRSQKFSGLELEGKCSILSSAAPLALEVILEETLQRANPKEKECLSFKNRNADLFLLFFKKCDRLTLMFVKLSVTLHKSAEPPISYQKFQDIRRTNKLRTLTASSVHTASNAEPHNLHNYQNFTIFHTFLKPPLTTSLTYPHICKNLTSK